MIPSDVDWNRKSCDGPSAPAGPTRALCPERVGLWYAQQSLPSGASL